MRALLLVIGSIFALSAVATGVGNPTAPSERRAGEWVRTVDGWEKLDSLIAEPRPPRSLHPLVVAGMMVFSSLGVLVAAAPEGRGGKFF